MAQTWTISGFAAEQFTDEQDVADAVRRVMHLDEGQTVTVERVESGWKVTVA